MPYGRYTTIADVRLEGLPFSDATTYPDAWVQKKIDLASEQIENFTGSWFVSIERSGVSAITLDGNRSRFLPLPFPIVQIDTITIVYAVRFGVDPTYSVDLSEVIIYNRHLTQGLLSPDDRKAPGIAVEAFVGYPTDNVSFWPEGDQNIKVEGKFGWTSLGFTDTVGQTAENSQIPLAEGSTPPLIERACMMLIRRAWPKMGDFTGLIGVTKPIGSITEMKSRDQSIQYADPEGNSGGMGMAIGGSTGDPEIDRMLLGFRRTPAAVWLE